MHDDLDHLRDKVSLLNLLSHYAKLAEIDRLIWQDRLMTMEGVEAPDISKLHGELIAFGWVEQNTGGSPGARDGVVPACYRATLAGIRAVQQIQNPALSDSDEASALFAEQRPFASKGKRKRVKSQEPELVTA